MYVYKFPTFSDLPLNASNLNVNHVLKAVADGQLALNLLLVGDAGAGKSELARHLPYWFYQSRGSSGGHLRWFDCPNDWDIKGLKNISENPPISVTGHDWIVLDEVDKVEPLKKLHQLNDVLTRSDDNLFILTANNLALIPNTIQSRCMVLNIKAPTPTEYLPYAQQRIHAAGKTMSGNDIIRHLNSICNNGQYDCRKYEQMLKVLCI